MTNTEVAHLKAALEAKRLETAAQLRARVKDLTIDEIQPELVDGIQRMSDRDETAGMLNRFTSTLADIDRSLRAIAESRYGICMQCEQPIPVRRLQSIPWAVCCVRCQEALEAGGDQRSGWGFGVLRAA